MRQVELKKGTLCSTHSLGNSGYCGREQCFFVPVTTGFIEQAWQQWAWETRELGLWSPLVHARKHACPVVFWVHYLLILNPALSFNKLLNSSEHATGVCS